ncbi:MAG: hypothetical protein B6241_03310 [Spirochaetaceae bacterium 4572_59]|nr:MAG: hypothetical protein B6241_03310 [Spirochaetaceae bacterium 4572_59]
MILSESINLFFTRLDTAPPTAREKQKQYDQLTYKAIVVGYPMFTIGALIFGAILAETAWSSFWSWDPKETCALIPWLFYLAF